MNSLENRRLILYNEIIFYKIQNGILKTQLVEFMSHYNINRVTRLNRPFYLPAVITNTEFFAPILRLQQQHNDFFKLNEPNVNAFKRYVKYEIDKIEVANLIYINIRIISISNQRCYLFTLVHA